VTLSGRSTVMTAPGANLAVQLRLGEGPVLKEYPPLTVLT
jgi:hypothetical protein